MGKTEDLSAAKQLIIHQNYVFNKIWEHDTVERSVAQGDTGASGTTTVAM